MFETPMAPTNAQPAAPAPTPEPYCIPLPGPSSQPAAQPAAPTASLAAYLGATDPVAQEEARILADELRQSDEQAFSGPETIAGYDFGQLPQGVERSMDQELSIRTLFQAEGIPAPIGNEIGRLWNAAAANPPSEFQIEMDRQKCSLTLERTWGPDMEARLKIAQAEVQRMAKTNPNIIDMLDQSGLGNSPWLIQTLHTMAVAKRRA